LAQCYEPYWDHISSASLFSRYGRLGFALSFVLCCLCYCFIILICLVCWCKPAYGSIEPFVTCWVFVHERIVVTTGFLVQASMSRLGEINRGSPKLLHTSGRSGDPCCSWASEHLAQARGVSPKQDPAWGYYFSFPSPRLGEGGSPERESLAWARPFSLSEELGEGSVMCDRFLESLMVNACLDLSIVLNAWDK